MPMRYAAEYLFGNILMRANKEGLGETKHHRYDLIRQRRIKDDIILALLNINVDIIPKSSMTPYYPLRPLRSPKKTYPGCESFK